MSKAVRFASTGGPEVLEVIDVGELHPGPGEVRVAVRAAGLNPYDSKVRSGSIPTPLPSGQGGEFAGVVDEVGEGVLDVAIGDEVLGWARASAHAEHVVVPSAHVAAKPRELDWATAGGLGLVANTAWRATSSLELTRDDTVLVTGASGGVGILTAQFALRTGAVVVGTAREADHEVLRRLGVIPVAYGAGAVERLRDATPGPFTAALDNVGEQTVSEALDLGIPAERINSVAYRPGPDGPAIGTVGGGRKSREELAGFARDAADGALILPVQQTFPLADVVVAYTALESTHVLGKLVLLTTVP